MNILIVKTSAIGDVTHTLPALAALRERFPDANIDWLVEEAAAGILRGVPGIDRLLVSRRRHWWAEMKHGPRRAMRALGEFFSFVRLLRSRRYQLLFDFQNLLKSSIFVLLARADEKIGFGRGMEHSEMSYLFLSRRIKPVSMDIHAARRELMLLEAAGVIERAGEPEPRLPVSREAEKKAAALIAGVKGDGPLVAVNPVATWETKLWSVSGFARVVEQLTASGCRMVMTGGPGDRGMVAEIIRRSGAGVENLCGRTSLAELAALYAICDLVISTDTGPMHIAAAAGAPVLAIFGPTAPWRTGPLGKRCRVLRLGLECSPCFKKICPGNGHACMTGISPAMVADEALAMLAS